ncbi:MAG: hypothetical protein PSX71_03645 [bacterium]|nr:hypothetical protein [bacterium]
MKSRMNLTGLRFPEVRQWLHWQFARMWASLGVLELFALALMALWLGVSVQVNQPLQAETVLLKAKVQALQARQAAAVMPGSARKTGADISQGFTDFLPADTRREKQLARLHQLADQHGLQLARVDYRIETVNALAVQRLSLRLSIQGGYALQRQFMHELLVALPNLALERISLEKTAGLPDSMNTLLDASLYYRPAAERSARL